MHAVNWKWYEWKKKDPFFFFEKLFIAKDAWYHHWTSPRIEFFNELNHGVSKSDHDESLTKNFEKSFQKLATQWRIDRSEYLYVKIKCNRSK